MKKSVLIKSLLIIYSIITALNTAGIIDVLPIENIVIKEWIKWVMAVIMIILGAIGINNKPTQYSNIEQDNTDPIRGTPPTRP